MQYLFGQVSCFRVAGSDCGVVPQQQVVHGSAHNLTAAHYHRSLPGYGHTCRGNGSNEGCNEMNVHYCRECTIEIKTQLCCAFTCLFDQRQAAVGCAGNEAISQVPARKLPCVYAGQSAK